MIYLDTNILIYAFCKNVDDETQKQKAQKILKESIISKQLVLSEISLYEFAFICKKLEEELEVINDNIDFLSSYVKNKKIYSEVLKFIKKEKGYKQSFDSYHIVFANSFKCNKLVTFDKGFKNFIKSSKTNIEIIQ